MQNDTCRAFTDIARERVRALNEECSIIERQIECIRTIDSVNPLIFEDPRCEGITVKTQILGVKEALINLYNTYIENFERIIREIQEDVPQEFIIPLKKVIEVHKEVLNMEKMRRALDELLGAQSALYTSFNKKLKGFKDFREKDVNDQIYVSAVFFPFSIFIELLKNDDLVQRLINLYIKLRNRADSSEEMNIRKFIDDELEKIDLTRYSQFYKNEKTYHFVIAENLIGILAPKPSGDPLMNFTCHEKCKMISKDGIRKLAVDTKILESLMELIPPEDISSGRMMEVPVLEVVVLEYKRLVYQPCVTNMLILLENAKNMLDRILSVCKTGIIGADDNFPFNIYCVAETRFWNLPSLTNLIHNYIYREKPLTDSIYSKISDNLENIAEHIIRKPYTVGPNALLPDIDLCCREFEHLKKYVRKIGEPFKLEGFALYSLPTFSEHFSKNFPCYLKLTSNVKDFVYVSEYEILAKANLPMFPAEKRYVSIFPSLRGILFLINDACVHDEKLLLCNSNSGCYNITEVKELSTLTIFFPRSLLSLPKTEDIQYISDQVSNLWKVETQHNFKSVFYIMSLIRKRLVEKSHVSSTNGDNDFIDYDTYSILQKMFRKRDVLIKPNAFLTIVTT